MAPSRCSPDPARRHGSARQRIRLSDAKPRRVGAWWVPADSWGYGPYRRPRYRLGGAE